MKPLVIPGRGVLVGVLLLGCSCAKKEEAPAAAPAASSNVASPSAVPVPPPAAVPAPPPAPLVSADTLREVETLRDKLKSEFPIPPAQRVQQPGETEADFHNRVRRMFGKTRNYDRAWRTFFVGGAEGGVAAAYTPAAKFIRDSKLKLKWECAVYDVRRWPRGGYEVLCSTASADTWDYSVIGYLPRKQPLKKGDVIRFTALNTGMPNSDNFFKVRLLNLYDNDLRFTLVGPQAPTP